MWHMSQKYFCNFWVHIKSKNDFSMLEKESDNRPWFCLKCTPVMFPSGTLYCN